MAAFKKHSVFGLYPLKFNICKLSGLLLFFTFTSGHAQGRQTVVKIHKMAPVQKTFYISTKNEENLIPFHNAEGTWGYLDAQTDSVVIQPKYSDANLFHNGIAKVYQPNPKPKNWEDQSLVGFIDTKGNEIFRPQFTGIYEVEIRGNQVPESALSDLRSVNKNDGTSGVISLKTGQWLFTTPRDVRIFFYDRTHFVVNYRVFYHDGKETVLPGKVKSEWIYFSPDFIKVSGREGLGLYSWDGKEILPPEYLDFTIDSAAQRIVANRLRGGMTIENLKRLASEKNENAKDIKVDLLDFQGHLIKTYSSVEQADLAEGGLGSFYDGGKTVYFKLKIGEIVKDIQEQLQLLPDGYEIFKKGEHEGLRSANGQVTIPARYRSITYLDSTLVIATTNDSHYFVYDVEGHQRFGRSFSKLQYLPTLKRFMVADDGAGQIDRNGNVVIPLEYEGFSSLSLMLTPPYAVSKDRKSGIIDGNGKTIIPFEYDEIEDTRILDSTKVPYFILTKNEKVGMVNQDFKWLLPMKYGFISKKDDNPNDSWFSLEVFPRSDNKYGLFNVRTETLIAPVYDNISVYDDVIIAAYRKDNNYSYQLFNLSGKALTAPVYSQMDWDYGYLLCRKDGKEGILDKNGNVLIPFDYKHIWAKTEALIYVQDENNDYYYMNISGKAYKAPENKK